MTSTTTPLTREQKLEQALQMVEPALGILRDMGPIVCKYLPGLDTVAAEVAAALATPATQQAEPPAIPDGLSDDDLHDMAGSIMDEGFSTGFDDNRIKRWLMRVRDLALAAAPPAAEQAPSYSPKEIDAALRDFMPRWIAAEQAAPPQMPEPELSSAEQFWIERRGAIIEALTARGLEICNDDNNVWLQEFKRAAPVAAEQAAPPQMPEPVAWRDMASAPLDNTLVRLLVKFDNHGIEDSDEPTASMGHCCDGEWNFVGWDWYRDEWTRGSGDLLGWLPMLTPEQAAPLPQGADARQAFELGWRTAANWTERDDLIADIGSPAYIADRDAAIAGSAP